MARESAVQSAQYRIFNKLCTAYMRTRDAAALFRDQDLKKELAISENVFIEALQSFRLGDQCAVEVIDSGGETYLRLGESSRYNCD